MSPAGWAATTFSGPGLRAGPRIDLKTHPVWDLLSFRIVEWILFLVIAGRVAYVHCAPPCTTWSLARQPRLRSRTQPMGFQLQDEVTQRGNALLLRAMLILWTVHKHGRHGSFEHPAGAYTWWAPDVRRLFDKQGCGYLDFAACSFGAPFRKPTRLGLVRGLLCGLLGRLSLLMPGTN